MVICIKGKGRVPGFTAVVIVIMLAAAGCRRDAQTKDARIVEFACEFSVTNVPETATNVIAWAPLPARHCFQEITGLEIKTDYPYVIVTNATYSNRIARFDFSSSAELTNAQRSASITFGAVRSSFNVLKGDQAPDYALHLKKDFFLHPITNVPLKGGISDEARKIAEDIEDPLARASKLYDQLVASIEYHKSGNRVRREGTVYSDAGNGNCADYNSLFITEARAMDIPVRLIVGFLLPAGSNGSIDHYHCWSEAYIAGTGWLPVDVSAVCKRPEKKEELFGGLDADRLAFTVGRKIELPGAQREPLDFFIYPYVEVDGKEHDGISKTFSFSRGLPE
ncbi:MAG: transglutaminase-like domain-containing protein [Verrucomicrobiota bacterium]